MIIFSQPSQKAGGVQTLIINIAKFIVENKIDSVALLDYDNGFIKKHFDQIGLEYNYYNLNDLKHFRRSITGKDVYVIFGGWRSGLKNITGTKAKILIWQVFPTTIMDLFSIRPYFSNEKHNKRLSRYLTITLINKLINNNALCFMSSSHYYSLLKYDIKTKSIPLLPIPFKTPKKSFVKPLSSTINISYIGRGEEKWKVIPVKRLLSDLYNVDRKISVHIITTNINKFKDFLQPFKFSDYRHKIHFYSDLHDEKLTSFLIDNIDLNFGMGTSVLESGALGIPTAFLDASYDELPKDYNYRWLFETDGYDLGKPLWLFEKQTGYNICELIDQIVDNEKKEKISQKCFHYVNENHSIDIVTNKFFELSKKTTLTVSKIIVFKIIINIVIAIKKMIKIVK